MPAAVGVKEGINLPRYPTLKGRLASKKADVAQVAPQGAAGGQQMVQMNGNISQADRDKMMADLQARMAEAEKNRKTVEFRMFYGDYKKVDGVMLPHHFQQAMGAEPTYEITIDKYKLNAKIDPKKFDPKKFEPVK